MNKAQLSKLFWAIKVSLIITIVYVAAGAVVAPFRVGETLKPNAASGGERTSRSPAVGVAPERAETAPDYSVVANSHLFGASATESDSTDLKSPALALPVKDENIDLKLVGTIASSPEVSRALIENSKVKTTEVYKVGQTVGAATIESIEPDRVVLRYRGQTRTLVLNTDTTAPAKATDANNARSASAMAKAALVSPSAAAASRLGQVEALFRKATIEPYVEKGQTEGLKLTGLENIPIALAAGLRNGDVVRSVNGQTLTSKQKAFQVLQKARSQPTIDIQLLRDGKVTNLSFNAR